MNSVLWLHCLKQLHKIIPRKQFIKYINPLQIKLIQNKIIILTPNNYILDKIKNYYFPVIKKILIKLSNVKIEIELQLNINNNNNNILKKTTYLNTNKNFDNFIEGTSNKFVKIAALEVSKNPGNLYNPLFIYGAPGTGKSHIVSAIGNYFKINQQNKKCIITNAETFLQYILKTISKNRMSLFKNTCEQCDILIIENIHFFSKQRLFQEEFYYIVNLFIKNQKQIILTSYNKPDNVIGLNKNIILKILEGLTIKITDPDIKAKIQILENISKNLTIKINKNIIKYIVKNTHINISQLEGLLKYIAIKSYPSKNITSLDFIKKILQNKYHKQQISINKIIDVTSNHYNVNKNIIYIKKRTHSTVFIRQIIFYFCKKLTKYSLAEIGYTCGKYNHATVLYSYKKIENLIIHKKSFLNEINQIKNKLLE